MRLLPTPGGASTRHVLRELRGGFLVLPGVLATVLVALGSALVSVEQRSAAVQAWADSLIWTVPREAGVAQSILTTIAGAIMTVLSIVYSVLLLVLTFASIQFSPRVITTFMRDRVNQVTLGMFLGGLTHALATLPRVHDRNTEFIPTLAVSYAMALALASLVCLVLFVHNMALSIQVNSIVARIARETQHVLREQGAIPVSGRKVLETRRGEVEQLASARSGYIQYIDTRSLVRQARDRGVELRFRRGVGQFVPEGSVVLSVRPGERAAPDLMDRLSRAIHIGPVRTLEGDAEFGVLQIVDIALKAISPAVNDPSTAILCVDYLSQVLATAAALPDPSGEVGDEDGVVRVTLPQTSFARLLDVAFDQIPRYARSDVAVSLRILRALADVADFAASREHRDLIHARARFVHDLCVKYAPDDELAELRERLSRVEKATAGA